MQRNDDQVDLVDEEYVVGLSGAALFAALTGALAYISVPIPLSPAPITLQPLGVFLMAVFLGTKWGGLSAVLYVLAGGLGAPIFANGAGGLGPLLGPHGGYLWSYPFAVALIGWLAYGKLGIGSPSSTTTARLVGALVAGTAVIYALGTAQMMVVNELALVEAIIAGTVVFLPGEAAKIATAIAIVRSGAVPDWSAEGIASGR